MTSKRISILAITMVAALLSQGCASKPEPAPQPSPEQIKMQNQVRALAKEMVKLREAQKEMDQLKATITAMDSQMVTYEEELAAKDLELAKANNRISPTDPDIINLKGNIYVLTREIDSLKQGMKQLTALNDSLKTKVAKAEESLPQDVVAETPVQPEEALPASPAEAGAKHPVTSTTVATRIVVADAPAPMKGFAFKADYQAAYNEALNAYFAKDFPKAIEAFQVLIKREPQGTFADNSQYWIGECYYSLEDYGRAIDEFTKVFQFPENNKSDHALFKIAISYQQLGDPQRARETMNKFILDYPTSELIEQAHTFLSSRR